MKMKKYLAMFLTLLLLGGLTACSDSGSSSSAADSTDAADTEVAASEASEEADEVDEFVVWGWNTDFAVLQELLIEKYPELEGRLRLVNCGGSDTYQEKLDAILLDPDNEDYPDMILLEVGYVKKYVESDYLVDLASIGITDADTANQYAYNLELGTDSTGTLKASFWQATPGSLQIRADLAETYLGTTDADELNEMFSSWESILEIAAQVNEASNGMVKLFSGYDDLKYIFLNGARSVGWYDDNDVLQMDEGMYEYLELSKTMYEEGLTFNDSMWGSDWYAHMDGDGVESEAAIAYCGCPWFTYWCLSSAWAGNTILVDAPYQFYWGGTGLAVTVDCSDTELAATIIRDCTCDTEFMTAIYQANNDYVNNTEAVSNIITNGLTASSEFTTYGDQNICEFYVTRGQGIDVSLVCAEDQVINESLFPVAVTAYAEGTDLETAIADFFSSVHDTYSYLKIN